MNNKLAENFSFGSLIRFALPTITMMLFMSFYTMVDGICIARKLGPLALSAVDIVFPAFNLISGIGVMLASGGSAIVAKKLGEGRTTEAKEDFTCIVVSGVVLAIVVTLFGLGFMKPILIFLGARPQTYWFCLDYAYHIFLFSVANVLQALFQAFFIVAGKPTLGLIATVCGGLLNIVLDCVFIFIFNWGASGAAFATGLGFSVNALFGIVWFSFNKTNILKFTFTLQCRYKTLLFAMFNGSAEMMTFFCEGVVTFLFNQSMLKYLGVQGVPAITIVFYAEYLLVAFYLGYANGTAPILSFNYGRKNWQEIRKVFLISLRFIILGSLITTAIANIFTVPLVKIFTPGNTEVFALAKRGLHLYSICFTFLGVNIYASVVFTALSHAKISTTLAFLNTFFFIVLALTTLPPLIGVDGIWLSVPFAEIGGTILSVLCFYKFLFPRWKSIRPC